MAKGRKTVDVKLMVDYANNQLARTDSFATRSFKAGICNMVEHVLFGSNNYMGYSHNFPDDCETDSDNYYSRTYYFRD